MKLWLAAFILLLSGANFFVYDPSPGALRAQEPAPASTKTQVETPAEGAKEMHSLISGNSLLGATLLNRSGESCGTVDRITLDTAGQTVHLVTSVGGVLGVGAKEIAIPLAAVQLRAGKDGDKSDVWLAVDATNETLNGAPPLEARESLELTDPGWVEKNANYYGVKSPSELPTSATEQLLVLTAAQLIGHEVVGKGDTATIGSISDVLFGLGADPVEYAIVSYGGTLGIGEHHVALPFRDLTIQRRGDDDIQIAVPHNSKTLAEQQRVTPTGYPELKLRSVRVRIER